MICFKTDIKVYCIASQLAKFGAIAHTDVLYFIRTNLAYGTAIIFYMIQHHCNYKTENFSFLNFVTLWFVSSNHNSVHLDFAAYFKISNPSSSFSRDHGSLLMKRKLDFERFYQFAVFSPLLYSMLIHFIICLFILFISTKFPPA